MYLARNSARIRESILTMILVTSRYANQFLSLNYVANTNLLYKILILVNRNKILPGGGGEGLHVILKLQINKFTIWLNHMHKIILTENPLRWKGSNCYSIDTTWNHFKWALFSNNTVVRMPLTVALPRCCHWLLPDWIGPFQPPPLGYYAKL